MDKLRWNGWMRAGARALLCVSGTAGAVSVPVTIRYNAGDLNPSLTSITLASAASYAPASGQTSYRTITRCGTTFSLVFLPTNLTNIATTGNPLLNTYANTSNSLKLPPGSAQTSLFMNVPTGVAQTQVSTLLCPGGATNRRLVTACPLNSSSGLFTVYTYSGGSVNCAVSGGVYAASCASTPAGTFNLPITSNLILNCTH